MGIFSKFRVNAVEERQQAEESEMKYNEKEFSSPTDMVFTPGEKGLIESVGEMLQHSAHNMKEAVFRHMDSVSDGDFASLPVALAMEDPFSQSDHVLAAVVEHDTRSSSVRDVHEDDVQGKTIVQTVRENLAHSAHIVKDAVLSHTAEQNGNHIAHAAASVEYGDNDNNQLPDGTDDYRRTMPFPMQTVKDVIGSSNDVVASSPIDSSSISQDKEVIHVDAGEERTKTVVESVGEMLTQSAETVKEAVLSHTTVVHEAMYDVRGAIQKQESSGIDDLGKPKEHEEDEEEKGLMQSVKDAAQEVKEEVMEAVQEVRDAVLSNDTMTNLPESITEDAGERPSMEFVHTIVHD